MCRLGLVSVIRAGYGFYVPEGTNLPKEER